VRTVEAIGGPAAFDPELAWRLDPDVALRDEEFGALAYHYGNRRLVFLKSRSLVKLVTSLEGHRSGTEALDAEVPRAERDHYERALARLAASGVIRAG
jgi:putative mycofactocin binding protein MftB